MSDELANDYTPADFADEDAEGNQITPAWERLFLGFAVFAFVLLCLGYLFVRAQDAGTLRR